VVAPFFPWEAAAAGLKQIRETKMIEYEGVLDPTNRSERSIKRANAKLKNMDSGRNLNARIRR